MLILRTTLNNARYKVLWTVDKDTLVFKKGPRRRQPRVFTVCEIIELNDLGEEVRGYGWTWQSWQDEHCDHACRKTSLARALKSSPIGKPGKTEFWQVFFEDYPIPAKPETEHIPILLPPFEPTLDDVQVEMQVETPEEAVASSIEVGKVITEAQKIGPDVVIHENLSEIKSFKMKVTGHAEPGPVLCGLGWSKGPLWLQYTISPVEPEYIPPEPIEPRLDRIETKKKKRWWHRK